MRSYNTTALQRALENEHLYGCDSNACDIHAAFEGGYYLWAANLLMGATECPETTEAFGKLNVDPADLEWERQHFVENTPHEACAKCGAVCWDVAPGHACGACGERFPFPPDEDDND